MFVAGLKEEQSRICDTKLKIRKGKQAVNSVGWTEKVKPGLWGGVLNIECLPNRPLTNLTERFLLLEQKPKIKQVSIVKLEVISS